MSISRSRLTILAAVGLLLAVAAGVATLPAKPAQAQAQAAPAPTVDVASVLAQTVTDWAAYSGRLEAVDRVDIRPLVSGTLTTVSVREGGLVTQGDPLFVIDPRPYTVAVERARAQLAAATTRARYTASELARGKRLLDDRAIAQREVEEKDNAAREARAQVQAAQAALDAARLDLEHTRITAPVNGVVSRAQVTQGNIVSAGADSPPMATLVSVSQLYAAFDVDEQSYLRLLAPGGDARNTIVLLGLAHETGYPRSGRVRSVDNRLDTASGTIRVHAVFDNPDGTLIPGLYARIRLAGATAREALLIDERAVGTDQDKRYVLVLDPQNRTAYREVQLGARHDGLRVVEHGLTAGERVVVNGLQRLRPGDTVTPQLVPMRGVGSPPPASAPAGQV